MKKGTKWILLSILSAALLCGCGSQADGDDGTGEPASEETGITEETLLQEAGMFEKPIDRVVIEPEVYWKEMSKDDSSIVYGTDDGSTAEITVSEPREVDKNTILTEMEKEYGAYDWSAMKEENGVTYLTLYYSTQPGYRFYVFGKNATYLFHVDGFIDTVSATDKIGFIDDDTKPEELLHIMNQDTINQTLCFAVDPEVEAQEYEDAMKAQVDAKAAAAAAEKEEAAKKAGSNFTAMTMDEYENALQQYQDLSKTQKAFDVERLTEQYCYPHGYVGENGPDSNQVWEHYRVANDVSADSVAQFVYQWFDKKVKAGQCRVFYEADTNPCYQYTVYYTDASDCDYLLVSYIPPVE